VNREAIQQYTIPEFDAASQALLARNPYSSAFGGRVAVLAASKPLHGLTASRTEFLGLMGDLSRPAALERIGLAGAVTPGDDPCAALQLHFDLPPGAAETVYFILGEGADRAEALQIVQRFQAAPEVDAAWNGTQALWETILGAVTVHTPDPALNLLLNRWLLYQVLACRI
jgi:cyclic beta-1,2-glucan synthetase